MPSCAASAKRSSLPNSRFRRNWSGTPKTTKPCIFLAYEGEYAIGTARLLGDGHIGRVSVLKDWRGLKVGDALMRAAIEEAERRGLKRQLLTAQVYAIPFYERLGFKVDSGEFLDAGLPHVDMVRDSD